jgi:excisionase family DNA binding protein
MSAVPTDSPLLRPREIAAVLHCSLSRVYQLVRAGELPHTKLGGALRVPAPAFAAWIQRKSDDALAAVTARD